MSPERLLCVLLFYIPGLHLKFVLPSNTHISDWDLISHDLFIHDPLLMNTNDPFLICTFPFTSQVTFTTIHFLTTFTEIQTKTDLHFEKGCQLYAGSEVKWITKQPMRNIKVPRQIRTTHEFSISVLNISKPLHILNVPKSEQQLFISL